MPDYQTESKFLQQRNVPYLDIWRISEKFREPFEAWDFMPYVFGLLFYKFLSQRLTEHVAETDINLNDLHTEFSKLDDLVAESKRATIVEKLGYFIPPSELYENVRQLSEKDRCLVKILTNVFNNIECSSAIRDEEGNLEGIFDDLDLTSIMLAETNERRSWKLSELMTAIGTVIDKIKGNKALDKFGEIFENLMSLYAKSAGRYGDDYFSPKGVSDLLARIATKGRRRISNVYDPACGTGSLLMKCADTLGADCIEDGIYGKEINKSTYNLCRMNMIMQGMDVRDISIELGNTLEEPKSRNQKSFDAIVSNLPTWVYWDRSTEHDLLNDDRYSPAGVLAPKARGELAFVMHSLSLLSSDGVAAISLALGALFRGGAELKIRKYLTDENLIEAVIQLPRGLSVGTSKPVGVIVLKKNRTKEGVSFCDASEEFEVRDGRKTLGEENISNIIKSLHVQSSSSKYYKNASISEIENKNYNLLPSNYIRSLKVQDVIEPKRLRQNLGELVKKRENLVYSIDRTVADITRLYNAT